MISDNERLAIINVNYARDCDIYILRHTLMLLNPMVKMYTTGVIVYGKRRDEHLTYKHVLHTKQCSSQL